jgi:hypothetical protein
MVDACPGVLQDAVQMSKTVPNQLVVTLHICDNVKETANCGLSLFLVLTKYKNFRGYLQLAHQTNVSASHH